MKKTALLTGLLLTGAVLGGRTPALEADPTHVQRTASVSTVTAANAFLTTLSSTQKIPRCKPALRRWL